MADGIGITITGANTVMATLNPERAMRGVKSGIKKATVHVKAKIAKYPPATEANRPGRIRMGRAMGYYVRGSGWMEPTTKNGIATNYILRATSEQLGRKWTQKLVDTGLTGIVGNKASYARWVQGDDQALIHGKRGWKTTDQIIEQEAARVNAIVNKELESVFLRGF